ncbi:hypothetical protein ACX0G9_16195 [Flavitalea flava]
MIYPVILAGALRKTLRWALRYCLIWLTASMLIPFSSLAQPKREEIYTDFVLYQKRTALEKDLRERIIERAFSMPLDSNSEDRYMSACWAISQFLFSSALVEKGFHTLFTGYDALSYDTKKAFLEAVYATYPKLFTPEMQTVLDKETDPKLFCLSAVYLFRSDSGTDNSNTLKIRMVEKFPDYDTLPLLKELETYLSYHTSLVRSKTPDIRQLFSYRQNPGQKVIYSFQRWNRDYPGLAIVQNADGSFARNAQGKLQVFEQLARSGSDLPYFITNGSTPQGAYSIQGTDISRTHFIGPTPNLQLLLPFEGKWERYFQEPDPNRETTDPAGPPPVDSLRFYRELWPPDWRNYAPVMEAWAAGKIGRTEIIAHGTTIDPEFFKDKPFYPLTPTMGCLCAKELWNPTTGHPLVSEQLNLVSAFLSTPGRKGYLFVINLDDQRKPVSREELEAWVK